MQREQESSVPAALLASGALVIMALGYSSAALAEEPLEWEFRVVRCPDAGELQQLAGEGWDYAGYLGPSQRDDSVSEGLWRRPKR